jgi:hypothetical protein
VYVLDILNGASAYVNEILRATGEEGDGGAGERVLGLVAPSVGRKCHGRSLQLAYCSARAEAWRAMVDGLTPL